MTALQYTRAVLMFSAAGFLVLYIIQRIQGHLPLNPISLKGVRPDIAMNTVDQLRDEHELAGRTCRETTMSAT